MDNHFLQNSPAGTSSNTCRKPAIFILYSHANLARKENANSELVLLADFLLNNCNINEFGVDFGLEVLATDFKYNHKYGDSSITRVPIDDNSRKEFKMDENLHTFLCKREIIKG